MHLVDKNKGSSQLFNMTTDSSHPAPRAKSTRVVHQQITQLFPFPGFHVSINEHSEIRAKALHLVEVLARPLVMYQTAHPAHWSPAYVGGRVRNIMLCYRFHGLQERFNYLTRGLVIPPTLPGLTGQSFHHLALITDTLRR